MSAIEFKAPSKFVDEKLDWKTLDVTTLPDDIRKLYDTYRAQYEVAKTTRKAFEDAFADRVVAPAGKRAVLGYLYGKLSFAFAPIKDKAPKAGVVNFAALTRK